MSDNVRGVAALVFLVGIPASFFCLLGFRYGLGGTTLFAAWMAYLILTEKK